LNNHIFVLSDLYFIVI